MKLLDSREKRGDAVLDNILAELKGKGGAAPKANDRMVDALLSEMGLGEQRSTPRSPILRKSERAEKPAAPQAEKPAVPRAKKPADVGSTAVFAPVGGAKKPVQAAGAAPKRAAKDTEENAKSRSEPEAALPSSRATRSGDTTSVWSTGEPRLGKAAAMDKMDTDKFTGDSELMSWYSGDAELYTSKKEQRKADKARKKRLVAEKKKGAAQDEGDYVLVPPPADAEMAENPPLWDNVPADNVVTGSAFEAREEEEWEQDGSLFDALAPQDDGQEPARGFAADSEKDQMAEGAGAQDARTRNTKTYDLNEVQEAEKIPTAAFTQEFDSENQRPAQETEGKNLFVDQMVDDRFREFFSETVIVDREEMEQAARAKPRRKSKKSRTALLTGELSKMGEEVEATDDVEFDDYNRPQDAEQVERDISALRTTMTRRTVITGVAALFLAWLGLAYTGTLPLPQAINPTLAPLAFSIIYLALMVLVVVINFTTIATGLVGLVGQPTVDSPPALAGVAGLLQAAVLLLQVIVSQEGVPLPRATLFGGLVALVMAFNTLGKRIRVRSVLHNFQLASAGFDHSAAYVLENNHELAYHITRGLGEEDPTLLVSRPTALVKGFLRQSFSQRHVDSGGRLLGWVLLGVGLATGIITYASSQQLLLALSSLTAVFCIGAPFSSTLVSAVPSALLQQSTSKVGAVVPGWSAIEELGEVNVVQAGARDIFPPASVMLKGIKTFQKERVDLAILYAASVLIEGCDTMRDIFLGVIQSKSDMLYKVESLQTEPGRGFTAWVQNSRVVIGTREMLQKHDIDPPPIEVEMRYTSEGYLPVYLAVSGKLFAMFVIAYTQDPEVKETLDGLVRSGVSLLVTSDDMNVSGSLIESVYGLPAGVIKVLGRGELEMMGPLTAYLPESEGVMTHLGTFTSFIGGMRAAAGCAASERMSGIVQTASVLLACVICLLLVFSGSLANLSMAIVLLYQLGWTVLVSALPFARRY